MRKNNNTILKNLKIPLKGVNSISNGLRLKKKKKYKLHALPTVRAEAEPLVRLTTGTLTRG